MQSISEAELVRLLDDEELGREAYVLERVTAWPSLRVLDYLSENGPATTGEIARSINMDMSEVRDVLGELADIGLVKKLNENGPTNWEASLESMDIQVRTVEGLEVEHVISTAATQDSGNGDAEESGDTPSNEPEDSPGPFTRVGQRIDSLLGFGAS